MKNPTPFKLDLLQLRFMHDKQERTARLMQSARTIAGMSAFSQDYKRITELIWHHVHSLINRKQK